MKHLKRFNEGFDKKKEEKSSDKKPKKLTKKTAKKFDKLNKEWTGSTPIEKKNKITEAIVEWETKNIQVFYHEAKDAMVKGFISFSKLKEIGDANDVEVVDYDTFYKELPDDKSRKDAPPKGEIPFFGLCNPVTHKARMVIQIQKLNSQQLDFAYHMLKHENVHVGQKSRKVDKSKGEFLGNIRDTKAYFSNKDEVMAFAQSVSDMIMDRNPQTLQQAIKMIDKTPLWRPIQSVDEKTKRKYKKYIYLYLQKEFEKRGTEQKKEVTINKTTKKPDSKVDYSKMSQTELKKLQDDALDSGDYSQLDKISKYIK